ncbi:GNAT family N-acetyltransferase [Nonomuraea sp. NPDC050663]|uniref:GNAT family N-acetyltransferase n=1 Tax=Nonomuraea sp. NPDC050663 TaxID=3364370 RepID=UPI00379E42B5
MPTGELVRLRALEPADAEPMWRWNNDPDVTRWMFRRHPESLAQITRRFAALPAEPAFFGIEPLGERRLIGSTRLRDLSPADGSAELDLRIGDRDFWGRGYATDAMRVICRHGFDELRLHRIALTVVAANVAAVRVYEKIGFVTEGVRRACFPRDGVWHDMVLMGLLEGELR